MVENGSAEYPGYKRQKTVLFIPSVHMDPRHQPSRHVDPYSPHFLPLHTGPPGEASFEAELLARTRHCQLFLFDHTASALPRGLSTSATLRAGLDSFYRPLDASNDDEDLDYWDSRHIWQRAHFKPYRIAGSDAHGMGDKPKTYTLESLMRQNGVSVFFTSFTFVSSFAYLLIGHTHIDILKIDLEGWEFDALMAFLIPSPEFSSERPRAPPVSQMLLELHVWNREFPDLLSWWSTLERAGLRAVAREPNLVYQNYNRMQGAELAEVRHDKRFKSAEGVVNRCDSIHSSTLRCPTFSYRILSPQHHRSQLNSNHHLHQTLRNHPSHISSKVTSTSAEHQGVPPIRKAKS